MKIKYLNSSDIPEEMKAELAKAQLANEAEDIFNAWSDRCFIEHRSRSSVWMSA